MNINFFYFVVYITVIAFVLTYSWILRATSLKLYNNLLQMAKHSLLTFLPYIQSFL